MTAKSIAGATAAALAMSASAALAATPMIPAYTGPPQAGKNPRVRPGQIVYTGDGSGVLAGRGKASRRPHFGHIHWTRWGAHRARGTGANWLNNCKPDCADGRFSSYPVKLAASRPRVMAGFDVFTRLKVTYTAKMPRFVHQRTQTWKVKHSRGVFVWLFPG
jgi:hypothetical protein